MSSSRSRVTAWCVNPWIASASVLRVVEQPCSPSTWEVKSMHPRSSSPWEVKTRIRRSSQRPIWSILERTCLKKKKKSKKLTNYIFFLLRESSPLFYSSPWRKLAILSPAPPLFNGIYLYVCTFVELWYFWGIFIFQETLCCRYFPVLWPRIICDSF